MSRKPENWKMILFPQISLTPKKPIGRAEYADENEQFIIEIIWDNNFVIKARSTLLITSTETEERYITIYVSDRFVNLLHEKDYLIAGLWHEIGHIHHGHLDLDTNQDEIRKGRFEAVLKGSVYYLEIEADAFATRCVGKNRMIRFMEFTKANRRNENDRNSDLALQEFDVRIKCIQKLRL